MKIVDKSFNPVGINFRGLRKSDVRAKYGEPDAKKAFNGEEWWEYQKVLFQKTDTRRLTLYIAFDGDVVSTTVGN